MSIKNPQARVHPHAPSGPVMVVAERLRAASVGIMAGLISGFIAGIGARVAMHIVALALGRPPIFTSETDFILIFGMSLGIALGLLYVALQKYLVQIGLNNPIV